MSGLTGDERLQIRTADTISDEAVFTAVDRIIADHERAAQVRALAKVATLLHREDPLINLPAVYVGSILVEIIEDLLANVGETG